MIFTEVIYKGRRFNALIDTGCSITVVKERVQAHDEWIVTLNGELLGGKKEKIHIEIAGRKLLTECVKVNELLAGVEIIIGLNAINELGGVLIRDGMATFGKLS